jgi:AcrR family transcriptional regulator
VPDSEGAAKTSPHPAAVKHGRRAEKAMNAIMDAAERLFAYNGIEGVSLRQILIEAKQRNKYAISLYFGTKEDLVFAIISRRIAEMNVRRRVLIAEARANGSADTPRAVLEIIFRPLAEVSDATGQYTYARFLHQAMLYHSFSARWPLVHHEGEHSAANRDLRRLASGLSEDMFDSLLGVIAGIFLSSITTRGLRVMEGRPVVPFDEFFPMLLDIGTAAFEAALPAAK